MTWQPQESTKKRTTDYGKKTLKRTYSRIDLAKRLGKQLRDAVRRRPLQEQIDKLRREIQANRAVANRRITAINRIATYGRQSREYATEARDTANEAKESSDAAEILGDALQKEIRRNSEEDEEFRKEFVDSIQEFRTGIQVKVTGNSRRGGGGSGFWAGLGSFFGNLFGTFVGGKWETVVEIAREINNLTEGTKKVGDAIGNAGKAAAAGQLAEAGTKDWGRIKKINKNRQNKKRKQFEEDADEETSSKRR